MASEPGFQTTQDVREAEFPLWPYLDTLYQWTADQPWAEAELAAAWATFSHGVSHTPPTLSEQTSPDQHDRVRRFWAWFHLDRPLAQDAEGKRPITIFADTHARALTKEGREVYDGLANTLFGAFKVISQFRLLLLEDLHTGHRHRLNAGPLADELLPGDLVVGRLYRFGEGVEGDPDLHIGHMIELGGALPKLDAIEVEARFFSAMVPAKGAVMDVLDALLLQVDSPLTADDVFETIRESKSLEAVLEKLYRSPAYRLRYLHLRDRSLLDELLQELWDTSGPLEDAQLAPADATALARTVREVLRAIADGNQAGFLSASAPDGFMPLYLDLFGIKGLQRLVDVATQPPESIRTHHQLLPKDGGILTTLSWGSGRDKHSAAMMVYGTPDGRWQIADLSLPETASPALFHAYERAQNLGWSSPEAADPVEALLRKAVEEVGYSVPDTVDLFRLWREFKDVAEPDLAQPSIWAAGVELVDTRFHNEDLDARVLAKSYGVMPHAIEAAAEQIEAVMREKLEGEAQT